MYQLNQVIFYMRENKLHSAPILSRLIVENLHDANLSTKEQEDLFNHFGPSQITYYTCHGVVYDHECADSKEELFAKL